MANSSLFSNHGNVILVLADDPESRLRDVAERVGITERAVQKIVRDLQDEGLLTVHKHGRRNRYRINTRKVLRHPLSGNRTVGQLLNLMRDGSTGESGAAAKKPPTSEDRVIDSTDAAILPGRLPAAPSRVEVAAETESSSVSDEQVIALPDAAEVTAEPAPAQPPVVSEPEPESRVLPESEPPEEPPGDDDSHAASTAPRKEKKPGRPDPDEQQGSLF